MLIMPGWNGILVMQMTTPNGSMVSEHIIVCGLVSANLIVCFVGGLFPFVCLPFLVFCQMRGHLAVSCCKCFYA